MATVPVLRPVHPILTPIQQVRLYQPWRLHLLLPHVMLEYALVVEQMIFGVHLWLK